MVQTSVATSRELLLEGDVRFQIDEPVYEKPTKQSSGSPENHLASGKRGINTNHYICLAM